MTSSAPPPSGADARVLLLVEDEPVVRALFARALRDDGHTVLEADTAQAALQLIAHPDRAGAREIALLITNAAVPGMSGAELVRRAQALKPGLPVLHVTGDPEAFPPGQARRRTDRHVLRKPVTPEMLRRAVRDLLGGPDRPGAGR